MLKFKLVSSEVGGARKPGASRASKARAQAKASTRRANAKGIRGDLRGLGVRNLGAGAG